MTFVVLFLLIVFGGIALVAIAVGKKISGPDSPSSGVARYVVAAFLTFGLLVLAVNGAGWLLGIALSPGEAIGGEGSEEISAALALSIVALPSFYGMWRYLARTVGSGEAAGSVVWSLFVAGANLLTLIGAVISIGWSLDLLLTGEAEGHRVFGFALAYLTAWVWSWSLLQGDRRPARLASLAIIGGSTLGLWVAAGAAAGLAADLAGTAYDRMFRTVVSDTGIGGDVLDGVAWLVVGALVWWWYWFRHGIHMHRSTLRNVHVLLAAILPAVVTGLSVLAGIIHSGLVWVTGVATDPAVDHFEWAFEALPTLALSWLAWAYYRSVVSTEPLIEAGDSGRTYRYLLSGVALIATVTGLGIVVGVVLRSLAPALAQGTSQLEILLGGITALLVGIPVWWKMWSPLAVQRSPEEITATPRRVYLTLLAGVGGIVAIGTATTLFYQLLQGLLEGDAFGALVESTRIPLSILISTGIVAAYHFSIWRRERTLIEDHAASAPRHITLAAGAGGDEVADALEAKGIGVARMALTGQDEFEYVSADVLEAVTAAGSERSLVVLDGGSVSVYPIR